MNLDPNEIPDFVPYLSIEVPDRDGSLLGYLAIDSVFNGNCCGGIRMCPDVTRTEIAGLAKAMSWKFAFMSSPMGGAKAGIVCPSDASQEERVRRLSEFGWRLKPLLRSFYAAGGDIGVGPDDLAVVKRAAGLSTKIRAGTYRGGYYTAYGVYVSIMTWLANSGIRSKEATVAIEGYGSVGRPLARLLSEAGVRIEAVSTKDGALLNEDGIDLDKLEKAQELHGDACVLDFCEADQASVNEIFRRDVTIVVPGARPWTIHSGNADKLNARAVISAANIPITPLATTRLEDKGVTVIPEFVSNSAGIFACGLLNQGFTESDAKSLVTRIYSERINNLLGFEHDSGLSLRSICERICETNHHRLAMTRGNSLRWLSTTLGEDRGLRRVLQRGALTLYVNGHKLVGKNVRVLPRFLKQAAVEAIFNRSVIFGKS